MTVPTPADPAPATPLARVLLSSVLAAVLFTLVCGLAYPLLTTLAGTVLFPAQAQGSMIERDGRVVGSALIGQAFSAPQYLHGRPSQTNRTDGSGPQPYNAENSGASNWGPTNAKLSDAVKGRIAAFRSENGLNATAPVPVDMVTASASGLDPDISVAGALAQVGRIAQARKVTPAQVEAVIRAHVTGRSLGFLGEERVNVLSANLALDALK
ncbi:K+-transporting ATPase ATPase C chain [Deinococcus metalli]|uniref:Potassium-transporting ATPase KdpC subunit n=1 Tax=Deinococcus metalli TaxID=1141878 RepID=A0A7W8NPX0_9DEIO|nr:potassium-transporting ATPase subunit KdpC [Deinococcus metalli]MBB5376220.1 K+-transporting ATPase ATPase C chain [Deinococcus metalli]GHF39877.1 potassium-transporting ATPase KdpC subunit [Deinococcus metalli]